MIKRVFQGGWALLAVALFFQTSRNIRLDGFVWQNIIALVILLIGIALSLWDGFFSSRAESVASKKTDDGS